MPNKTPIQGAHSTVNPANNQDNADSAAKPEAYRLLRDDDVPLKFRGIEIGSGQYEDRDRNDFLLRVTIYKTTGGLYVVRKFMDANHMRLPKRKVACLKDARLVVAFLRDDESTKIDEPSLGALAEAAKNDPAIEAAFCEVVD